MHASSRRRLFAPLRKRSTPIGIGLFLLDAILYAALLSIVLLTDRLLIAAVAGVLLGAVVGNFLTLAHDAAHNSLTNDRRLNQLLGRISFLIAWHNIILWRHDHNAEHHAFTNLKGMNAWSPMAPDEYRSKPWWRRLTYRLSRSPLGFGPYYLIYGWLGKNTLPIGPAGKFAGARSWRGGLLLLAWMAAQLTLLWWAAGWRGVVFGALVPHLVFCWFMGWAIWRQHTHPGVPWFATRAQWAMLGGPEEVSIRLDCPRVFHLVSHWMMLHPAHHADPNIPCYRLTEAERLLEQTAAEEGERILVAPSGPRAFAQVLRTCQLYDFDRHAWISYDGTRSHPTGAA